MSTQSNRVFDPSALSAQRQVTEWVAIKEKLGTKVAGEFVGFWNVPARGKFRAQTGVALRDFENKSVVYGINVSEYFQEVVSEWAVGDACGFEYYNDKPASEPGMSPTKQIRDYNPDLSDRKKKGEVIIKTAPQQEEGETEDIVQDYVSQTDVPLNPTGKDDEPF